MRWQHSHNSRHCNTNDTITDNSDGAIIAVGNNSTTINANGNNVIITAGNGNNTITATSIIQEILPPEQEGGGYAYTFIPGGNNDVITVGNGNNNILLGGGNSQIIA